MDKEKFENVVVAVFVVGSLVCFLGFIFILLVALANWLL